MIQLVCILREGNTSTLSFYRPPPVHPRPTPSPPLTHPRPITCCWKSMVQWWATNDWSTSTGESTVPEQPSASATGMKQYSNHSFTSWTMCFVACKEGSPAIRCSMATVSLPLYCCAALTSHTLTSGREARAWWREVYKQKILFNVWKLTT